MHLKVISFLSTEALAQFFYMELPSLDRSMIEKKELSIDIAVKRIHEDDVWSLYIEDDDLLKIIDFPKIPFPTHSSEVALYVRFLDKYYDVILLPLSLKREMSLRIAEAIHVHNLRIVTVLVTGSLISRIENIVPLFDFFVGTRGHTYLYNKEGIFCTVKNRQTNKRWLDTSELMRFIEKLLKTENCFYSRYDWGHGCVAEFPRLPIDAYMKGVSLIDITNTIEEKYGEKIKESSKASGQIISKEQADEIVEILSSSSKSLPRSQYNIFIQAIKAEIKNMTRYDVKNNQGVTIVGKNKTSNVNLIVNMMNKDNDKEKLISDLLILRKQMKNDSVTAVHDASIGHIAQAEEAIKNNDPSLAVVHLKSAGNWALAIAEKFSIAAAIEVLKWAINT